MTVQLSFVSATVLGLTQGITEFLPVSSSGHVALAALFLDGATLGLEQVVALHVGTLLATLVLLRHDLGRLLGWISRPTAKIAWVQQPEGQLALAVLAACVPTGIIGVLLEPSASQAVASPAALGACFCVTATCLWFLRKKAAAHRSITVSMGLVIGIAQGIAVLPGISRSGITLACGLLLGLSALDAFRFSFLIAIPAIVGATLYTMLTEHFGQIVWPPLIWGAALAGGSGYVALLIVKRVLQQQRLWWFSLYLYPLGIALLIWSVY
ncbi:MAG: undecaprenyl-diphosphate phosphatase [Myxococcales bacterium]|nr:undecaprenyl-diphosphate phosphatase [Myxococcales bacterium]